MRESDLLDRITSDPGQCGGRPCIRGLRIRVVDIPGLLAAGETPEEILSKYPYLERNDISASLIFMARRLGHPVIAAKADSAEIILGERTCMYTDPPFVAPPYC